MLNKLSKRIFIFAAILFCVDSAPAQNSNGLPSRLYQERREKLRQTLGDSSALILLSAPARMREWDSEYEYNPIVIFSI